MRLEQGVEGGSRITLLILMEHLDHVLDLLGCFIVHLADTEVAVLEGGARNLRKFRFSLDLRVPFLHDDRLDDGLPGHDGVGLLRLKQLCRLADHCAIPFEHLLDGVVTATEADAGLEVGVADTGVVVKPRTDTLQRCVSVSQVPRWR